MNTELEEEWCLTETLFRWCDQPGQPSAWDVVDILLDRMIQLALQEGYYITRWDYMFRTPMGRPDPVEYCPEMDIRKIGIVAFVTPIPRKAPTPTKYLFCTETVPKE